MVDFHSRDTSRGLGDDEDDEDEETEAAETTNEETASESPDEDAAESAGETESDGAAFEPLETDESGDSGTADDKDPHDDEGHDEHTHSHDDDHGHHAHDVETVSVAIVIISSSRTRDDDPSGDAIQTAVEDAGHEIATRDVIRDDYDGVQNAIDAVTGRDDVDVVVTTGGTGVTPDDVTIEAVEPLMDKELPGFGELFRQLSYDEIGTKVVGTRATAGIVDGVPVFCLPGSENAVRLGTEEIVLAEAPHLAGLATRDEDGEDHEHDH